MRNPNALMSAALTGLLALTASAGTATARADEPKMEKCFGIVKTGKNDCQTSTHACASTAKRDGQKDAWIDLPKGSCEKIVGGTLTMK